VDAEPPATPVGPGSLFGGARLYGWLTLAALIIAAVSLLFPSTPSYDPWSWLVWGREILHGSLHTPGGPTWKPLPVIFTTILAVFGHAQPNLWLLVARAGALLSVLMVFVLVVRLVEGLRDPARSGEGGGGWMSHAPAVIGGLIAMASLGLTGEYLSSSTLGYSEGLMLAACLIALDRHLDGHHRQAFVFGFVAALDRPEIWLFWGPYGLWLMWRDPGARAMVIGLAVLTLFLWFVPQKWGGGSWFSGVARAQHPRKNSAAFAACPFCAELVHHAWPLVLLRMKVAAALSGAAAAYVLARSHGRRASWWRLQSGHDRALMAVLVAGVFGLAWWILVALETQGGFSGNDRYLVLGSAFIVLAGGVGFGWLALALARLARGRVAGLRRSGRGAWTALATAVIAALLWLLGPNWVAKNLIAFPRTHGALLYQAHLREDLAALIQRHGGAQAMLACGPVMTEGFQVPMVAWYLNVRTARVLDQPDTTANGLPIGAGRPPATILQARANRGSALLPLPQTITYWEQHGSRYHFEIAPHHTIYFFQRCRRAG
jgi:hypothetical protein